MEPVRSRSLALLVRYTDTAIGLSDYVPGSGEERGAAAREQRMQRDLWALAARGLDAAPTASAPRLYVETLNEMIDAQTVRIAALNNRVPNAVLILEVVGAALALGLLAAFLAIVGRGVTAVSIASVLVAFLLLVTCDLDRPTRGMIRVPDNVLTNQRASMELPPQAGGFSCSRIDSGGQTATVQCQAPSGASFRASFVAPSAPPPPSNPPATTTAAPPPVNTGPPSDGSTPAAGDGSTQGAGRASNAVVEGATRDPAPARGRVSPVAPPGLSS